MTNIDQSKGLNEEQLQTLLNFQSEYIRGFQVVNQFDGRKKATFYGAARVEDNSHIYQDTYKLAQELSKLGYVVLNGGGPGMMEAATNGAESVDGDTIAITVNIAQEAPQDNADKVIATTNFSVRKYLLRSSDVLIYVPGGIGTLDELAEVLVLAKFNKIPNKKIFLYNTKFWDFLEKWLDETLIKKWGMNYRDYQDIFHVVDTPEQVIALL
jgi:uncharacterized protein (TIGR00730 family)